MGGKSIASRPARRRSIHALSRIAACIFASRAGDRGERFGYGPGMRYLTLVFALAAGCAPANYAFSFDLTDPGARNLTKPGERDAIEDADVKSEILVDATSFQAILLDLTNKTEQPLQVGWDRISITGPDGVQTPIKPDTGLGEIEPGAKVVARLVPFVLPSTGKLAAAYDGATFELVVPVWVRGQPREYRYHLRARANKL
jgi:hypothetical protein